MTPDQLTAIGRRLFGPTWKPKLAKELGRSRSTIWNWVNGKVRIPKTASDRIRQLSDNHTREGQGHE